MSSAPRPAARRAAIASFASLTLMALLAPPVHAEKRVVVNGRVLAESGQGMPSWPVSLLATSRYVEISSYTSGGKVTEVAATATDANGYFTFDVARKRGYHFLFLRLSDPARLDTVKYLKPADIEITAQVRRGGLANVEAIIKTHPDWPEVDRRIKDAGGELTPRGRILRSIGLPEKIAQSEMGEEEWWYFTRGVVYLFRGAEAVGSRRFDPVVPPGAASTPDEQREGS
jgi:hypothetical protein